MAVHRNMTGRGFNRQVNRNSFQNHHLIRLIAIILLATILVACGGGGGAADSNSGKSIDLTPPSKPDAPTDDGDYTPLTTVTYNWAAATDNESGVSGYNLQIGTTPGGSDLFNGSVGKVLTKDCPGSNGQTLYARVQAVNGDDVAGEWSDISDGITIDTTAPTVNAGADKTTSAQFTQNATVSGATGYQWSKQSGVGVITFGTATAEDTTISADTDDTYVIRLTATDDAGNSSYDEITVTWDTAAPTVNAGADKTTNAQFTQNATVSGATGYQWSKISGSGTITFGSGSAEDTTISADADDSYTIRLMATDAAGNSAFDEITIVWDTEAPTITFKSPSNGATGIAIDTTISATFSKEIDQSTVSGNFTLSNGGSVSGSLSYSGGGTIATFTPDSSLSYSTLYTASVTTGVKDSVGNAMAAGEAWSFTTAGEPFSTEIKKLLASDAAASDKFGWSVAVDGTVAIVGANSVNSSAGAVYIFEKDEGGTDNWGQVKKITASDAALLSYFGQSVAISGDYAIVGAKKGNSGTGSAYIFYKDPSTGWPATETKIVNASDAASGDLFGWSVSISGDYAIVGARGDNSSAGSAYVFEKDEGGTGNWGQAEKITASDAASSDSFGRTVSISGDYAIVGAVGDESYTGSAYIFYRDPSTGWPANQTKKITASDAATGDQFGWSVAISGDYAIIGAFVSNGATGSAYIFYKDPSTGWPATETKIVTASDAAAGDQFGYSVAISGDYAIVGSRWDDDTADNSGSVYIYHRDPSTGWPATETAKVNASDAAQNDNYGRSVAISGDYAIAGAELNDDSGNSSGSAYILD